MKTILKMICCICLLFVCSSCLFFFGDSFAYRDSLENATAQSCLVTANFAFQEKNPRPPQIYVQQAESFCGFESKDRNEPLPVLTNIVIRLVNSEAQHSLSVNEITKLRKASGGALSLVLYNEGIGCVSPTIQAYFETPNGKHPYNKEEHFQMLKDIKREVLQWTKQVLNEE
jgi:hypothetical protein